jgi:anti-anti-sigma factor
MSEFSYSIDRDGPHPVLFLSGDIDLAAVGDLETGLDTASAGDVDVLVLDMSEVTFIDSSGLRVLFAANDQFRAVARSLEIRRPSAAVMRLLEITGTEAMMTIDSEP